MLVTGGYQSGPTYLNSAELYDPSTNTWSLASGTLATGRNNHHTAALTAAGQVLVVGGSGGADSLKSAELWDATAASGSLPGDMTQKRTGHTLLLLGMARCW